jgi:hypothetical protein
MKERLIGHCGLDCSKCDAFVLKDDKDDSRRAYAAMEWEKLYGYESLKASDIICEGCLSEKGSLFMNCRICPIRICANQRNVSHCVECKDYPCGNLRKFHANHPDAKHNLDSNAE